MVARLIIIKIFSLVNIIITTQCIFSRTATVSLFEVGAATIVRLCVVCAYLPEFRDVETEFRPGAKHRSTVPPVRLRLRNRALFPFRRERAKRHNGEYPCERDSRGEGGKGRARFKSTLSQLCARVFIPFN